jgi:hypothetical protein
LPKQRLGLPLIVTNRRGFAVSACRTSFVAYVIRASPASSAHNVDGFALAFAL